MDGELELLIGRITSVEPLVGGRVASYELTIDFGPRHHRRAFIAANPNHPDADSLLGRQIVCGLRGEDTVVLFAQSHASGPLLLSADRDVEDGTLVS